MGRQMQMLRFGRIQVGTGTLKWHTWGRQNWIWPRNKGWVHQTRKWGPPIWTILWNKCNLVYVPQPNRVWGQILSHCGHASLSCPKTSRLCYTAWQCDRPVNGMSLGPSGAGRNLARRGPQEPPVYNVSMVSASVPVTCPQVRWTWSL